MDVRKTKLISGMMTGLLLIISLTFNSCVMDDTREVSQKKETLHKEDKTQISFKNDIFYFNRYIRVTSEDEGNTLAVNFNENGNIEMYGNTIRVKKTSNTDFYFIKEESYNDEEQIYTFTCDRAIVVFDVTDRQISVHQTNSDEKEVFYINSTIKSNW